MKSIFCSAALISCAVPAYAQSSVTLYGLFDTAVSWQSHQAASTAADGHATSSGASVSMGPGFFSGSRWGLTGTENLGGGMSAIFRVESGFNPSTGVSLQGNRESGRQAYVGIGGPLGQLTFGRQYSIPFDVLLPYDTILWGNSAASDAWVQLLAGGRLDNTAKYALNRGNWTLTAAYSFGGGAGSVANGSTWAVGANYRSTSAGAGATVQQARDPNGHKQWNLGAGANVAAGPLTFYGFYLYARRDAAFAPSTGQDFSPTYGSYSLQYNYYGNTNVGAGDDARTDHVFQLGAAWQAASDIQIRIEGLYDRAVHVNAIGESGGKLSTFLTGNYLLSKRTDVYLAASYSETGRAFNGPYAGYDNTTSIALGLRHRF